MANNSLTEVLPSSHKRTSKPTSNAIHSLSNSENLEDYPFDCITPNLTTHIQIVWEDIRYEVKIGEKTQEILKGVSGCANPGEFLAIMGSSGAGKTSLLNILASRIKSNISSKVTGSIKANGIDINKLNFEKYSAYITQEDILLPYLTVEESLIFAASLKIPGTSEEIKAKVDKIVKELRLEGVTHSIIGNHMKKGISGGEKKRACIAIELISEPQVIILDEPTSGLDSFTAEVLIDLLIEQTNKGRTVITTIHQPSSSVFKKFDKLILVSEGHIVYQGFANKSRKYFAELGYKSPRLVNPADYFMRLLHVTNRYNITDEEAKILNTLTRSYNQIDHKANVIKDLDSNQLDLSRSQTVNPAKTAWILFKRALCNESRNPGYMVIRTVFYITTSILIDLLFHNLGNNFQSIQNISGVLFFMTINSTMIGSTGAAINFPAERPVYLKEYNQGLYSTFSYLMTKTLAELPGQASTSMLAAILMYFVLGLNLTAGKFFYYFLITLLIQMMGVGWGYLIGAICPDEATASGTAPMILSPLMAFGGSFGNLRRVNSAFSWVQYISPFKYGFEAFSINQYTDMNFDCDPSGPKCDPLGQLSFHGTIESSILWLILYVIVIRIIAYIELKLIGAKQKK